MTLPAQELEVEDILFDNAMKGRWDKVVESYGNSVKAKEARITKAGYTALHVAVSNGLTKTVQSMVNAIKDGDEAERVLSIGNERGNTALHLAAQLGDLRMCESMVEKHKGLVSACNMENETPIFCAARHGKMSVFLYLNKQGSHSDSLCRNKKLGDTILHAAISGEYLDLALQIVEHYPELVNSVNVNGQTPLHMLASKPNLFKSSYRFRLLDYLVYPCILIDPLSEIHSHEDYVQKSVDEETQNHPQNYNTCMSFIQILMNLFKMFRDIPHDLYVAICKKKPKGGDQENPQTKINKIDSYQAICKKKPKGGDQENPQTKNKIDSYKGLLPPNYAMIIQYFKLIVKALLIVLGIGISRMQKLTEVKRRHTWAIRLMNKLVEGASLYKYDANGRQPPQYDPEALDRITSAKKPAKEDQDGQDKNDQPLLVAAKVSEMMCQILKTHPEAVVQERDGNKQEGKAKEDTAFLIAAKKGVVELVGKILEVFPVAMEDLDCNGKNVVLLAVENRQPCVYKLLLDRKIMKEATFRRVDVHGNSALHLAAMAGGHRPWLIPGAALQMQWELKWFKGYENKAKVNEDTAFLIAAKKGVVELVEKILDVLPVAIEDLDCNEKNAVLLAVENRQPCVYNLLLDRKIMKEAAFRQVDVDGNSALHLAAMASGHRPWLIPGAALQMQWELKWFKFVKNSMPPHTFAIYNNKEKTPQEVFKDTHQDLIAKGTEWLTKTSESFSVVAALIATVAFSTSANIPGGVKEDSGAPNLKNQPAFTVFSISSIIALCFSVTALVFFLAILTSRFQEKNFARDLPRKLLVGLTALFTSVASILVSFCAGHFYLLGDHVRSAAYPIYAVTCFPVTFFVLAQLPLYFDLIVAIVNKVPQPSHQDSPC